VLTKTNRTKISPAENLALIKLCQEGKALETLAASLAPSIYGHETVKKGLVLLLVGAAAGPAGAMPRDDGALECC
jgi:DNA replication licensing factor MCM3